MQRRERHAAPLQRTLYWNRKIERIDAAAALGPDAAAVRFGDTGGNGEAQAVAVVHGTGRIDAVKALENIAALLRSERRRLKAAVRTSTTYDELLDALTTVRYPRARMRRLAMDAALGFTADSLPALPPYLHLLGGKKDALPFRRGIMTEK